MNDFFELICVLIVAALCIALFTGGAAVGVAYGINRPSCYAQWRDSGLSVRWSLWGDCQVSEDGKKWITDDAFVAIHKSVRVRQ